VKEPQRTRWAVHGFCDSMARGWIGRTLPRLFADAGLTAVQVQPETLIMPSAVRLDAHYGFGRPYCSGLLSLSTVDGSVSLESGPRSVPGRR
jgi:hypothetical protein